VPCALRHHRRGSCLRRWPFTNRLFEDRSVELARGREARRAWEERRAEIADPRSFRGLDFEPACSWIVQNAARRPFFVGRARTAAAFAAGGQSPRIWNETGGIVFSRRRRTPISNPRNSVRNSALECSSATFFAIRALEGRRNSTTAMTQRRAYFARVPVTANRSMALQTVNVPLFFRRRTSSFVRRASFGLLVVHGKPRAARRADSARSANARRAPSPSRARLSDHLLSTFSNGWAAGHA